MTKPRRKRVLVEGWEDRRPVAPVAMETTDKGIQLTDAEGVAFLLIGTKTEMSVPAIRESIRRDVAALVHAYNAVAAHIR